MVIDGYSLFYLQPILVFILFIFLILFLFSIAHGKGCPHFISFFSSKGQKKIKYSLKDKYKKEK
jgi:uncharacterized membrane protein